MQQFGTQDEQNDTENNTDAFALETAAHDPRTGLAARERGYGGGENEHPVDFGHGGVAQKTGQRGKAHDEGRRCGGDFGGCLEHIDEERHDENAAADSEQTAQEADTGADADAPDDFPRRLHAAAFSFIRR